jgi:FtsH-binding integral membrane protein
MAFAQSSRPIPGAVATVGVSDRVTFLRKTYAHLGIALLAFAALTGGMMRFATEFSLDFTKFVYRGGWSMLLIMVAFIGVGYLSERLARSESSRALQYLGLALGPIAYALILQPLLWVLMAKFGSGDFFALITQATVITLSIFVGLTLTVFLTKKDFSFMRGALVVCTFAALGIIIASIVFGFTLGAVFCGAMILLMAGYILYETSVVMRDFPPTHHVAAALMLFSTVATLFFYVLRLLGALRSD